MTSLTHLNKQINELSERSEGKWQSLKKIVRSRYDEADRPAMYKVVCFAFLGGAVCERFHKSRHASGKTARHTANFFLRHLVHSVATVSGGLALGLHPVLRSLLISKPASKP